MEAAVAAVANEPLACATQMDVPEVPVVHGSDIADKTVEFFTMACAHADLDLLQTTQHGEDISRGLVQMVAQRGKVHAQDLGILLDNGKGSQVAQKPGLILILARAKEDGSLGQGAGAGVGGHWCVAHEVPLLVCSQTQ